MTSRTGWPRGAVLLLLAGVAGCGDGGTEPAADVPPPDAPLVEAVGLGAVRIGWISVSHPDVTGYEIQRRASFAGSFEGVGTVVHPGGSDTPVLFFDSDLLPDTYYGYRVVTLTRFDTRSKPSVVRAARTPPVPAIRVETQTTYSSPASVDPDGYVVTLLNGSPLTSATIGLRDSLRFDSLPTGAYQVALAGLAPQCALTGEPMRDAKVVDVGVNTVDTVRYSVACRDPSAGEIVAVVSVAGDSLDANGYVLELVGVAADASLPDSLRAVVRTGRLPFPPGGSFAFTDLPPGDYDVTLTDVAPQCAVAGPAARTSTVRALESDTLQFAVVCDDGGTPVDSTRPFVWRNQWSADSVANGQPVRLDLTLDLRADAARDVGAVQATLRYDSLVLRYDSIVPAGPLPQLSANGSQRGLLVWGAFTSGTAPKGEVALARAYFTAIGAGNSTARTRTADLEVAAGDLETRYDSLVRVVEDTVRIRVGASGGNQPPQAEANGPYTGVVNAPVSFSAAGSVDPDGTIVGYQWTFGDGGAATGASPTHAYAAAGTYRARLTVTDNQGATGIDSATVTVSATGGNQPPVAVANGPYSGAVNSPITFTATGSFDPDGSVASYTWFFGDGSSASGATVSRTYTAAGTYTVTLTVVDNLGASSTAQTTATVTSGSSSTPFTWASTFGPVGADTVVTLTITLDLTNDIPETPGAEALATWAVDSLKWNPAVLQYLSFNFGQGAGGTVNPTNAATGKLVFSGTQSATQNNAGVVTIARIRFRVVGTRGAATATQSAVGPLLSIASLGAFNYRPKTAIQEAAFTVP
jgi:PKD repeat protein